MSWVVSVPCLVQVVCGAHISSVFIIGEDLGSSLGWVSTVLLFNPCYEIKHLAIYEKLEKNIREFVT